MLHQVHVCPNGLTLITCPSHAHPVVSVQFWVQSGSIHEGAHLGAGLSHLLEHMVFKGTEQYSGQELNERVPALGGLWNAYTSTDRTVYHIDGPAEHWREFLHLLTQLVFHPTFPRNEFELEREVIRREMAMYRDDPQEAAYRALIETLYHVHPRRLPVIGEQELFDALSYEDMLAYHRIHYVPGNVFVCMAGDIDAEAAQSALQEETAHLAAGIPPGAAIPAEPYQWGPRLTRREFMQPTSSLMLAWRIPCSNHPDAAPLTLLADILGNGRSAWLYKRFHDETGLAHDVSVSTMPSRDGEGAFLIEADVETDERDRLRDELLRYVQQLPQLDFTAARERSCRRQQVQRLRSLSTVQGLSASAAMSWHLTRNLNCMDEWADALQRVTPQQLAGVAARYLTPARLTEVSIDPPGTGAAQQAKEAAAAHGAPSSLTTLPNGLRLVLRRDSRIPMAWCTMAFGAGCGTETAANAGINSLLSECILKGTATRSAGDIADTAENLGGSISSSAGNNTLCFSTTCLAGDLPGMLELLADVVLHPTFPGEAIDTEKEAMIADIEDAEAEPATLALRRLRRACYGEASYGHHPDGTAESVASLTREQLLAQHEALFCASNAVLTIAGDIDTASLPALVERLFGGMPAGVPAVRTATPPQQPGAHTVCCDREQAVFALAVPACSATDTRLPGQLLFEEWCRDMAGPIFSEIREKRGLAYYASATSLLGVDAGCLVFYLGTSQEKLGAAREALLQTLERLVTEGIPADALERSRATALAGRLLSMQSAGKIAGGIAVDTLLGLGPDYTEQVPGLLRAVTCEEVNAFIRQCLSGVRTEVSVMAPPAASSLAASSPAESSSAVSSPAPPPPAV